MRRFIALLSGFFCFVCLFGGGDGGGGGGGGGGGVCVRVCACVKI